MSTRRAAVFDAFVQARGARLLRTAHLLCGDRLEAERLLGDALSATWRTWRRARTLVAAEELALTHLVAAARSAPPPPEPLGRLPEGIGLDAPERLAARTALRSVLASLPPQQRAVLVLRQAEGLPATRVAAIMKLPVERVHAVEQAAMTVLTGRPELAELSGAA